MWDLLGIWLASLVTLCIFSFLYKDNPFYKFAEHLFVGISAGYGITLEYYNVFLPNLWKPLTQEGRLILIVPLIFGILLFTRFIRKYSWFSRWPMALIRDHHRGIRLRRFDPANKRQSPSFVDWQVVGIG
jgi:hypothetical protein